MHSTYPSAYMLSVAFTLFWSIGAVEAAVSMRTKQTRTVAISNDGGVEQSVNRGASFNGLMRNKLVSAKLAPSISVLASGELPEREALDADIEDDGEDDNLIESEAQTGRRRKQDFDSIEEWLRLFQEGDCLSVTTALEREEADYIRDSEHLCPAMHDALTSCLKGCPTMSFDCVYRAACELADGAGSAGVQIEAQKVCDKMTAVAVEAALVAEGGDDDLHAWKETKGGKGAYYKCFPPKGGKGAALVAEGGDDALHAWKETKKEKKAPKGPEAPTLQKEPNADKSALFERVSARAASDTKRSGLHDACLEGKEDE